MLFINCFPINKINLTEVSRKTPCLGFSFCHPWSLKLVGNKAKGRISKRVFQKKKARQIFRKTNIFYPLIRTSTCAHQGVKNVRFTENLACFFLKHPFWDSHFRLITDELFTAGFPSPISILSPSDWLEKFDHSSETLKEMVQY